MRMRVRVRAYGVVAGLAAGLLVPGGVATEQPASASERAQVRLLQAVRGLPVARETRRGYDRDKFRHWVDADRDCRDTRDEVLAAESRVRVHGCDVRRGRWRSYYDGKVVTDSGLLDIDHLVALAEAWDSGAKRWNAGTRRRFANDLGDGRSLVAVTASVNRAKSDRDPAEWLPPRRRCRYVREWVAVKTRWSLTVDRREKRVLRRRARACGNPVLTVRPAKVVLRGGAGAGGGGGAAPAPAKDPRFDTCAEALAHGYGNYVRGRDPEYDWYRDADGDGVVCER